MLTPNTLGFNLDVAGNPCCGAQRAGRSVAMFSVLRILRDITQVENHIILLRRPRLAREGLEHWPNRPGVGFEIRQPDHGVRMLARVEGPERLIDDHHKRLGIVPHTRNQIRGPRLRENFSSRVVNALRERLSKLAWP